uniref:hypothetical protein n=1 Tax=Burkholderia anthina TaxID=179879 RepID=UPI001588DAE6|nr:hypothetical protein [Burkholderia anthina]
MFEMFMRIKRVAQSSTKTLAAGEGTWLTMAPRYGKPRTAKADSLAAHERISQGGGYTMRIWSPARSVSNMKLAKRALPR